MKLNLQIISAFNIAKTITKQRDEAMDLIISKYGPALFSASQESLPSTPHLVKLRAFDQRSLYVAANDSLAQQNYLDAAIYAESCRVRLKATPYINLGELQESIAQRLQEKRIDGYAGWWNAEACTREQLQSMASDCLSRSDFLDAVVLLLMLTLRGIIGEAHA